MSAWGEGHCDALGEEGLVEGWGCTGEEGFVEGWGCTREEGIVEGWGCTGEEGIVQDSSVKEIYWGGGPC